MTNLSRALVLTGIFFFAVLDLTADGPNYERIRLLAQERYGDQAVQTIRQWQTMIEEASGLDNPEKVKLVNDFFNTRIRFVDDIITWNVVDYWATPLEFMGRGQGDCEDFAIAKYVTLKTLSIPTGQLRLVYTRAGTGGPGSNVMVAHMVVAYFSSPDADPLILDNLIRDIRPAAGRGDLLPVFSFNSDGLWMGNISGSQSFATGAERLSRWHDVITRMQAEGFE
jgi:predicted transglutaminase-like cysteine proteinase